MIESLLTTQDNPVGPAATPEVALTQLLERVPTDEPIYSHLKATHAALSSGDWTEVGALFREQRFFDRDGWFWLTGPYSVLRMGRRETLLTGLFGRRLEVTHSKHLMNLAYELFGMGEQRRRYLKAGRDCIKQVFEPDSAELLLSAMDSSEPWFAIQHKEFSYHEIGHSTGLGLKGKLSSNLLATPWYRAVDVNATLLSFDRLLTSGALRIGKTRKLRFQTVGFSGLLDAVQAHRQDAIQLTRDEICLGAPEGIWGLYGSVPVSRASRSLFQDLVVEPCHGFYSCLN